MKNVLLKSVSTPFDASIEINPDFLRLMENMNLSHLNADKKGNHYFFFEKKRINVYVGENGYWHPFAGDQPTHVRGDVGTCFGISKINGATYVEFQVSNTKWVGQPFFLHRIRFEVYHDKLVNAVDVTEEPGIKKVTFETDVDHFAW